MIHLYVVVEVGFAEQRAFVKHNQPQLDLCKTQQLALPSTVSDTGESADSHDVAPQMDSWQRFRKDCAELQEKANSVTRWNTFAGIAALVTNSSVACANEAWVYATHLPIVSDPWKWVCENIPASAFFVVAVVCTAIACVLQTGREWILPGPGAFVPKRRHRFGASMTNAKKRGGGGKEATHVQEQHQPQQPAKMHHRIIAAQARAAQEQQEERLRLFFPEGSDVIPKHTSHNRFN